MPRFDYLAYGADGTSRTGSVNAVDRDEAVAELRRQGLAVAELTPRMAGLGARGEAYPSLVRLAAWFASRRTLRTRDVATMARALAVTQAAGVPTFRAVSMLAEEFRGRRTGEVLARMEADVADGASLAEAMRRQEHQIGAVPCAMVESGEATGQLEPALERLAAMLEAQVRLKRKLWSVASHPLFTVSFALIVFVVMVIFVVPAFERIYEDFEADLPGLTANVVAGSRFVLRFFYLVPVAVAVVVAGCLWMLSIPPVRARLERAALRVPLFGRLMRDTVLSRVVSVVASSLTVGVPLLHGLMLARGVAGNDEYARAVQRVQEAVSEGSTLYPVIVNDPAFPPLLRQVVKVGEESATLPEMLGRYVEALNLEIESTANRVVSLMEIGLIVVVGSLVAFMLAVLYLPIFHLAGLV